MKRLYFTLILLVTTILTATAQYFPVDTARLNNAYKVLLQNPQSSKSQSDFFRAFPDNWDDFNSTYKYRTRMGTTYQCIVERMST